MIEEFFKNYQVKARQTAIYPEHTRLFYPALGLAGEAGEVANKIKKIMRDNLEVTPELRQTLKDELGDCLWYIANLATDLNLELEEVAGDNLKKLKDRQQRGVLGGSGDNR